MHANIDQTSITSPNLAAHVAEAAEQFGLVKSPTDANSHAKVIQYGDIAPQSEQAQQPAKSDNRTCDATDSFTRLVTAAITLGSGSRERSRQALQADYVAAHAYENAGDHKESYKAALEKQCADAKPKIDVTDRKTTPFHMIVKLTFTDVTKQFVSDKVHVLRVALAHDVKPDAFLTWLEAEKGERNVVVTYNRDGTAKPPKSSNTGDSTTETATTQRASKSHLDLVRDQLKSSALITLAKGSVGNTLDDLKTDIELSAIVVRQADGTFVVKTVVEDSEAVDAVYAGYYRANAAEIDSAVKQKNIEEMLANPEDLTVPHIRKKLGDDIADKAAAAANQAKAFRDELKTTPPELEHYVSLLKAADFVANARRGKSSDSHYEKALEELEQVLGRDPSLGVHLDREFSPDIDPNQEDVPRPINSKSHYAKAGGATITKQDMLRQTLRQELDDLRGVSDVDSKAADAVIASGMALLNKYVTRG